MADETSQKAPGGRKKFVDNREPFLDALRKFPNVKYVCRQIGMSKSTIYEHRRADPAFAAEMDEAIEVGVATAEKEAWRRGHDGIERAVYYQGQVVGTELHYSDALLMRILEARHPDYRRRHEISGPDGAPLAVTLTDLARRAEESEGQSEGDDGDEPGGESI